MHPLREAKLKPEYGYLYPGLEPGSWFAAATVAEFLIARARTQRAAHGGPQRSLNPEHFEFRGGTPLEQRGDETPRARQTDP